MLGWLFASPAERRLLGEARLRGPTAWVVAIMSFSIMIIAAAGLALANTAGVLSQAIQARYSVEIPGAGGNLARASRRRAFRAGGHVARGRSGSRNAAHTRALARARGRRAPTCRYLRW